MKVLRWIAVLLAIGIALGWYATRAKPLPASEISGLTGNPANGATVFAAAGCASCHTAPEGAPDILAGGQKFPSDFGTFVAPNISPDPTHGIGSWSDLELASAIVNGTSPDGRHYYPAFPYSAYNKANMQDVVDLIAHLRTLPASPAPNQPHDVGFPFNIRATIGGWKWLFTDQNWVLVNADTPQIQRGRYLVEALGHCTECHTARNALGGLEKDRWLAGAPTPSGDGRIPNITPAGLSWSAGDIAEYLKSGFTPDFDTAGGEMVAVIKNTSQLSYEDRSAIALYLKAIPGIED